MGDDIWVHWESEADSGVWAGSWESVKLRLLYVCIFSEGLMCCLNAAAKVGCSKTLSTRGMDTAGEEM